jgi:putative transcriptional regulator
MPAEVRDLGYPRQASSFSAVSTATMATGMLSSCINLAAKIGITPQNLSILKTGKARAIRMESLAAICRHLQCQPGDILEYIEEGEKDDDKNT